MVIFPQQDHCLLFQTIISGYAPHVIVLSQINFLFSMCKSMCVLFKLFLKVLSTIIVILLFFLFAFCMFLYLIKFFNSNNIYMFVSL